MTNKKILEKLFYIKNKDIYKIFKILFIKFKIRKEKIYFYRDYKNIKILLHFIKLKRNYKNEVINIVNCISDRIEMPEGGTGGGSAVLSCMKKVIGVNNQIKYTFSKLNKYSLMYNTQLADLWGAIQFAFDVAGNERNVAYISHDYGTAFGLYLLGKKYVHVSHVQGSRVEEKLNLGEHISFVSKLIIRYCEKMAFKNAKAVYFPSEGAYKYFCNSKYKTIKNNEFNFGGVLYNTLYAYPEPATVENISKDESKLTFLSVGQLTTAKGMDKHTLFFDKLLQVTNKNIRYIFVGKGPLENSIIANLDKLKNKYLNFEYIHIKDCTYPQMQYLQNISDVYLMLHRISIFDLTTLELMNKSKCIILSNVGGNPEFSKNKNIILVDDKKIHQSVVEFCNSDINKLGVLNKQVYDEYFNNQVFIQNYIRVITDLIE